MARARQRSGGLFVPPPASLPDDDPYGDVPDSPPAAPAGPQTGPSEPAAAASLVKAAPKKRAAKTPAKKKPVKTVGEGSASAPPPAATAPPAAPAAAEPTVSADLEAAAGPDVQVQLYIPAALHTAIADYKAEHWRGTDVPTYAQLSVWACEDHREEVIERATTIHGLRNGVTKDVRGNRSPRGTRRAKPQVPIGPRYSPGDAAFLQELTEEAGTIDDKRVRRTTLVAASLAVAVKHPPQARPTEPTEPVDEFFS